MSGFEVSEGGEVIRQGIGRVGLFEGVQPLPAFFGGSVFAVGGFKGDLRVMTEFLSGFLEQRRVSRDAIGGQETLGRALFVAQISFKLSGGEAVGRFGFETWKGGKDVGAV